MWPTATVAVWSVCVSLCRLVTTVSLAKMAEWIGVPFGVGVEGEGARNHALGGATIPQGKGQFFGSVMWPVATCVCSVLLCTAHAVSIAHYSTHLFFSPAYGQTRKL